MKKRRRVLLLALLLAAMFAVQTHAATALTQSETAQRALGPAATVTTTCELRERSSTSAKSLAVIPKGSTVNKLAESGSWSLVVYENQRGYVKTKQLSMAEYKPGLRMQAAADINVRSGAGEKYEAVGAITAGTLVEKIGSSGKWAAILYEDQKAYVFAKYLHKYDKKARNLVYAKENTAAPLGVSGELVLEKAVKLKLLASSGAWYKAKAEGITFYIEKARVSFSDPATTVIPAGTKYATLTSGLRLYETAKSEAPITAMQAYTAPQRVMLLEDAGGRQKIAVYGREAYAYNYDLTDFAADYVEQRDQAAAAQYEMASLAKEYRETLKQIPGFVKLEYDDTINACVIYVKQGTALGFRLNKHFRIKELSYGQSDIDSAVEQIKTIAATYGWVNGTDYTVRIDESKGIVYVNVIGNNDKPVSMYRTFVQQVENCVGADMVDIGLLVS